jgi:CBS domain-containing protein
MFHKASDIMTKNVLSVNEDTPVSELIRLFVEHKISSAPVMNGEQKLVGIVTKTDILGFFLDIDLDISVRNALKCVLEIYAEEAEDDAMQESIVRNIMTPDPVTAEVETTVKELARTMVEKNIHRIIITENGGIQGIVSTLDILYHVAGIEKHERTT